MKNVMNAIMQENRFVSLYTDEKDSSKFIFGKIIALDDVYFAFSSISPNGDDDGIIIMQIERVYRVETQSKYEQKMLTLMKAKGIKETNDLVDTQDVLLHYLFAAKKSGRIVSIEINESGYEDILGYIASIEDNICCINQIDLYGKCDGKSYIRLSDISQFEYGSDEEKQIELLLQ